MSTIVAVDLRMGILWSRDYSICMQVSPERIRQRLPNGLGFAFFHATLTKEGILDLGEPAPFKLGWPILERPNATLQIPRPVAVLNPREARVPETAGTYCPCGARQHKGLCTIALDAERRAEREAKKAEEAPPATIRGEVVT